MTARSFVLASDCCHSVQMCPSTAAHAAVFWPLQVMSAHLMPTVCAICRRWIIPVLNETTEDIFIAAGFDAVIMLKTIEIGVQLFGPFAIVALTVCTSSSPQP